MTSGGDSATASSGFVFCARLAQSTGNLRRRSPHMKFTKFRQGTEYGVLCNLVFFLARVCAIY